MRRRSAAVAVAIGLACAVGVGAAYAPVSVQQTMSISGRVVSAGTGLPVPNAALSMNPGWDVVWSATTDANGRFRFDGLGPARYSLRARAAGHAARAFGEELGLGETRIALNASRPAVDLEFVLQPGGTIAGVVTNDRNEPVVKAAVRAVYRNPFNGEFTFIAGGATETETSGAYRLTGLGAGEYLVVAADGLSRAFAPAESSIATARRISLGAELEQTGVNIRTTPIPTGVIEGVFSGIAATGSAPIPVNLLQDQDSAGLWPAATVRTPPGKPFAIANVPVGRYVLSVRPAVVETESREWARDQVTVTANGTTRATVTLREGARMTGVVSAPELPRGWIRISPIRSAFPEAGESRASVNGNGPFAMAGIAPGRYRWVPDMQLTRSGRWLLSAFVNEEDITDVPLDMTTGASIENVRVTLTAPAQINGTVLDATGNVTTAGAVIVASVDSRYWTSVSRRVRLTRADTGGYFEAGGLPPGRYRITHVARLATGQQWDPAFLRTLGGTQEITLLEGQVHTVQLRLK